MMYYEDITACTRIKPEPEKKRRLSVRTRGIMLAIVLLQLVTVVVIFEAWPLTSYSSNYYQLAFNQALQNIPLR